MACLGLRACPSSRMAVMGKHQGCSGLTCPLPVLASPFSSGSLTGFCVFAWMCMPACVSVCAPLCWMLASCLQGLVYSVHVCLPAWGAASVLAAGLYQRAMASVQPVQLHVSDRTLEAVLLKHCPKLMLSAPHLPLPPAPPPPCGTFQLGPWAGFYYSPS